MANFLLTMDGKDIPIIEEDDERKMIDLDYQSRLCIFGKKATYCYIKNETDFIVSIGYVCHPEYDSALQTLSYILNAFNESQISDLKKKLIGQFIIIIKKDQSIYIFSDFFGIRNIFYSYDGSIVSSSFSQLEKLLHTNSNDLDSNKVFEFFAMRNVLYPSWIGRSTKHKRIKWLLPYEYLKINLVDSSFILGSASFSIDNRKELSCSKLSTDLLGILKSITYRKEYIDSLVAASLTGGRDSRLIAAIVASQYPNLHYRTALSSTRLSSIKDFEVAQKIAKIQGIPLDVYEFQSGRDEERFSKITEGFAPLFNHSITPLIDSAQIYALGFGGVLGTELFLPIRWDSIINYIEAKLNRAKRVIFVENNFWDYFYDSLLENFKIIKETFQLTEGNDRDYIRLFQLFNTARYASFIISAFNRSGYQLEPYGNYAVLELAMRVAPIHWGNHKSLRGDATVQKMAMANLNPAVGKVMTYSTFRPMLPLSPATFLPYLIGYAKQHVDWFKDKMINAPKKSIKSNLLNGYHISDGWDKPFIERTVLKYGVSLSSESI